ncbi:MAG: RluA family pseudouridine synthase [Clostridia bacterium]|nr:RluA family pseudouridine synthase [Clostridia bacterium]
MENKIYIAQFEKPLRLDSALCVLEESFTRSTAARLIREGKVLVNGEPADKSLKVGKGEEISVEIAPPKEDENTPQNIPLQIVFEDEHLLVVNKPKGMVVHPAAGNPDGTLVNALLYHCGDSLSGIGGVARPGIVHRIDKNTSGLLIVAKTDTAHIHLAEQIKEHSFTREYEGIIIGCFKEYTGTINAPIGRHPTHRKKMAVTLKNSKEAITHYEVLQRYDGYSHVRFKLETGRTHQIRVHSSYMGHPILGDEVYGGMKKGLTFEGQCLHAKKIGFIHPISGEYLEFDSELPEYFAKQLESLS